MPLLPWLKQYFSNDRIKIMEQKIEQLTQKVEEASVSPIRIEYANIENLIIEKFEHNNNFGALGIKELGGTLNIGANYAGPMSEKLIQSIFGEAGGKSDHSAVPQGSNGKSGQRSRYGPNIEKKPPACNIRPRRNG